MKRWLLHEFIIIYVFPRFKHFCSDYSMSSLFCALMIGYDYFNTRMLTCHDNTPFHLPVVLASLLRICIETNRHGSLSN